MAGAKIFKTYSECKRPSTDLYHPIISHNLSIQRRNQNPHQKTTLTPQILLIIPTQKNVKLSHTIRPIIKRIILYRGYTLSELKQQAVSWGRN
jgi:hypothetical protein